MAKVVNMRKDPFDVYIGRPGSGVSGYFGNPIKKAHVCSRCGRFHVGGGDTLACYADYLVERCKTDKTFRERIEGLRGKILGCFCPPKGGLTPTDDLICHGQVILAYLELTEK